MTTQTFLIFLGLIVLSYPLLHAWVLRSTESTRMKFVDCGRALLTDPSVSETHKELVSDMLDDVFTWKFMAYATWYFPAGVFFRHDKLATVAEKKFLCRSDVERFFSLHMRSAMAASPAWSLIFIFVAMFTISLVIVFFGVSLIFTFWADTVKTVSPHVHSRPNLHKFIG